MVELDKLLYDVNVTCPICRETFKAPKVRKSALVPDGRHTDFYVQYRGFDPIDYSVWQCPACGYASADTSFADVNPAERHVLKEALQQIEPLSLPRERDTATTIALFERAVYFAKARNSYSRMAGLYLRIAWVHRREGNAEAEQQYLAKAFDNYLEAYQNEPFPIGKMSELTVLYLLGELARRLGRYNEAVQYFASVTQSRDHQEPQIVNMAKEQWELTRREAEEAKAAAEAAVDEAAEEAAVAATTAPATADAPAAADARAPAAPPAPAAEAATAATASAAAATPAAPAPPVAAESTEDKPVLTGFAILASQLAWLQAVAERGGNRLDRSEVMQAVLAAVQTIPPERLAQPTKEQLRQALQQEMRRA